MIEYEKLKEVLDFLHTPIRNGGAGMTVTEVSKLIGKDRRTLATWFRRIGLRIRSHIPLKMGVLVNEPFTTYLDEVNGNRVRKIPFIATEELLWLLGFALADGSTLPHGRKLEIGNTEFGLLPILKKALSKYGRISVAYDSLFSRYYPTQKTTTVEYKKNVPPDSANYFRINLYNAAFCRLIKNEFQSINPETIESAFSEERWARAFLAGLWDADGWVFWNQYKRRDSNREELTVRIGIAQKSSVSKYLINKVRSTLTNWGIGTRETRNTVKSWIIKNGKKYHSNSHMSGLVVANFGAASRWVRIFNGSLRHPEKIRRVNELVQMGFGS